MKSMWKNHGWIYWVSLVTDTFLLISIFFVIMVSFFRFISIQIPLNSDLEIDTYIEFGSFYTGLDYDQLPPLEYRIEFGVYDPYESWMLSHLWGIETGQDIANEWYFKSPLWIPLLLLIIWPAIVLAYVFRNHKRSGYCLDCDYDLRGTPSGACPECGAKITSECKIPEAK